MRECRCPKPVPHPKPGRENTCVKCGFWINPEWSSNDENLSAFLERLAESQFFYDADGQLLTPPWWDAFVAHVFARERLGRTKFGYQYLQRNNPAEATEEAVDGAMYMYLYALQKRRAGQDEQADTALTAAYHFAQAHRFARMLLSKEAGSTGPGMDE